MRKEQSSQLQNAKQVRTRPGGPCAIGLCTLIGYIYLASPLFYLFNFYTFLPFFTPGNPLSVLSHPLGLTVTCYVSSLAVVT